MIGESGDDLQWEKAGILEVADIVVIHKADLPGAEQTEAQIRSMLELGAHRDVPRSGLLFAGKQQKIRPRFNLLQCSMIDFGLRSTMFRPNG